MRSASAFGAAAVIVVGERKKGTAWFGSHGADKHVRFVFVASLAEATAAARERFGCASVCGVEIRDDARAVGSAGAFRGSTAFILGNEGDGLLPFAAKVCDSFVYIPHHGGGTASLNVACAASIVVHRFAEWAGYAERAREGEKFVVAELPEKRGAVTEDDLDTREWRRARRAAREDAAERAMEHGALGGLQQQQQQQQQLADERL